MASLHQPANQAHPLWTTLNEMNAWRLANNIRPCTEPAQLELEEEEEYSGPDVSPPTPPTSPSEDGRLYKANDDTDTKINKDQFDW